MSDEERRDIEEKYHKGLEELARAAKAMGMSFEEVEADLRAELTRLKIRIGNLTKEGFTLEQAKEILEMEEGVDQ